MRTLSLVLLLLLSLPALAQNVVYRALDPTVFGSNNFMVSLKSGVPLTNPVIKSGSLVGNVGTATNSTGTTIDSIAAGSGIAILNGVGTNTTLYGATIPSIGAGAGNRIRMFSSTPGTGGEYLDIVPIHTNAPTQNSYGQRTFFTIANENGSHAWANGGILGEVFFPTSNTNTLTARQSGLYGYVHHEGSGVLGDTRAVYGISGVYGSGSIGTSRGGYFTSAIDVGGSGSIIDSVGAEFPAHTDTGSGSIHTTYGIKLAAQTVGTNANWTLYSAGGNNYFGGKILVGTTTDSFNGVIQLAASVATNAGIAFGTRPAEVLYRLANDQLQTDSRLFAAGFTANQDVRAGLHASYDLGSTGTRFRNAWLSGTLNVSGTTTFGGSLVAGPASFSSITNAGQTFLTQAAYVRTNTAVFDSSNTDIVIGTAYTNVFRRLEIMGSFQLSAAAAGTAKVTVYSVLGVITNKLSISAGPLASLTTIEPLVMRVQPGGYFYYADETSGAGASVSFVAGTHSQFWE